jgi:hypothetical protein
MIRHQDHPPHRRTKATPLHHHHHPAHETSWISRASSVQHPPKHAAGPVKSSYHHHVPRLLHNEQIGWGPDATAQASSMETQVSAGSCQLNEGVKGSLEEYIPQFSLPIPLAHAQLLGSVEESMENQQPGAYHVLPSASERQPPSPVASRDADFAAEDAAGRSDDFVLYHRQDDEEQPPEATVGNLRTTFPTLVEASVVTEPDLVEAEPVTTTAASDAPNKGLWQVRILIVLALSLTVVALAVGLSLGLAGTSPTDPSGDEATAIAASEALLQSVLPNYTVAAWQNLASAPFLALRWVSDDGEFLSSVAPNDRSRRLIQRYLLALLAYAFSSDPRYEPDSMTWLAHDASECEWYGCSCTDQDVVREIVVRGMGLLGTMPREVGLLSSLEAVDTGNNSIGGPMPTEIGALTRLTDLRMDHTQLSRPLPTEVARLHMLTTLLLDSTQFEGTIPSELGLLSNLERLDLSNIPSLGGTIPRQLCQRIANKSLSVTISCSMIICNCDCICRDDKTPQSDEGLKHSRI